MQWRCKIWTIPNLISLSRLILIFPIIVNLARSHIEWALFWILIAIGTDSLDGFLARRFNQRSQIGRILDPIADKISWIGISLFLVISPLYELPLWFVAFIIIRETIVLICGLMVMKRCQFIMESQRVGKISAFLTGVTVIAFILKITPYNYILLWISVILTLFSSTIYMILFFKQISQTKNKESSC